MSKDILEVTDADFEEQVVKASDPTLVDFWAEWCAPCRAIAPVVAQLAETYKGRLQVVKMNIDQHPHTAGRYGIRAIPTLLLFKDGGVVDQLVGLVTKDKIEEMIGKHT